MEITGKGPKPLLSDGFPGTTGLGGGARAGGKGKSSSPASFPSPPLLRGQSSLSCWVD